MFQAWSPQQVLQLHPFPISPLLQTPKLWRRDLESPKLLAPTNLLMFGEVSNAALANAALVLSSKNGKNIQDGGQRRKQNPKSLGLCAAVRE